MVASTRPLRLEHRRNETVVREAVSRLQNHPHFRGRTSTIHVEYRRGDLVLSGQLPSFYLKQVLQTIVRDIWGVHRIVNNVDVTNPYGVSTPTGLGDEVNLYN